MTNPSASNSIDSSLDLNNFESICAYIEKQYGQLLESMPDGILLTDTTGKIVFVNSHTNKLFGYDKGELKSQDVEILVPTRFREYHVELRNAYIRQPEVRPMGQDQLAGLRKDGREVSVEICLSPMQSEAGTLICAAVRDVTRRAQVEDALRTSEEQVRLLLDSTVEAIYGLDLQGNCTFCNRACVETLGYQHAEQLLGQNMHNLIHHTRTDGTYYPMKECRIYESFRLGKGTHVDDEIFWKANGMSFPVEYRSIPVHREGKLVGSVVTFLDISEQKRVAEAMRVQQSELTHAARLSTLGEMAAGLAHELNQPLTAMSAFAEGALARLGRGNLENEDISSVFSRITEDAQRAGEIIRRLRNFVQKREAQRQTIDINSAIRDVHKFIEWDAKQKDIALQFVFERDLPPVEADLVEIQQVLINLFRNAYDALESKKSHERRVQVKTYQPRADLVEVVIDDSGPGISESLATQVFEPFYTSKPDGLGIGLGICQNIIEAYSGKIWIDQSSMGGASVHFCLPTQPQGIK